MWKVAVIAHQTPTAITSPRNGQAIADSVRRRGCPDVGVISGATVASSLMWNSFATGPPRAHDGWARRSADRRARGRSGLRHHVEVDDLVRRQTRADLARALQDRDAA